MLLFSLSACRDDDMPSFEIGEGEADIAVEVKFEPMTTALENTRTPGNAIKEINTLAVIVYNSDKELVKVFNQGNGSNELIDYEYKVDGNTEMPKDENGDPVGNQSEKTTAKATFKLPSLPYGKYKIYAVANMGTITEEDAKDIDNLKNKRIDWNADDIASNNQMFGYFTAANDQNGGAEGFDAPTIIINKDMKAIHAWIKRVVSKVTVAFDSSGLKQRVWIYIHDVSIRDIPLNCLLGADNTPDSDDKLTNRYNTPLSLLPASGKLIYGKDGLLSTQEAAQDPNQDFKYDVDESVYTSWLTLSRGSGIKGSDHSETAEALYFFENMQGDFEGKGEKFNKQISSADIDGECITEPTQEGFKNNVPYGTFIEVTGYYVSDNPQNTTKGKIKYRFMLGKNDTYNFNAQRNHHYKLTLGFDGWANQPKWNIEYYEQDPGLYVPDNFYVSYLYNQKHMMPIKIVGDCEELNVEIIENNWAPYNPETGTVPGSDNSNNRYGFRWNSEAYNTYNGINYPELGFLALQVAEKNGNPAKNIIDMAFQQNPAAITALKSYYTTYGQNSRTFTKEQLDPKGGEKKDGGYDIGNNGWQVHGIDQESKMLLIPLWTRNKTMINSSGYSGNNPYDSYQRKAVLRITGKFKNPKGNDYITLHQDVPVYQVRRIVNPKGVWHRYDDNNGFDVTLMRIKDFSAINSSNYFSEFNSEGEWKAFVEIGSNDFFELAPKGKSYKTEETGDTIIGDTGTPIEFKINFKGVAANTSKCAIVKVLYHGDNCVHKIMVRQGYMAPMAVADNGAKWSSFSLYSCDENAATTSGTVKDLEIELTVNPLALGTFFKRNNTKEGIRIINNNTYGPMTPPNNGDFILTGKNNPTKKWSNISANTNRNDYDTSWGTFKSTANGKKYRLPTYDDFKVLEEAEFGFGVLYTDGTTETAKTYDSAYGYQAPNNLLNGPDTGKGARGIIVYNGTNANQIFFPVGKNGMGRRTQWNLYRDFDHKTISNRNNYYGILRYGDTNYPLKNEWGLYNIYRPIPYNIPYNAGAIYWIDKLTFQDGVKGHKEYDPDEGKVVWYPCGGWDMNYFNFDFNSYPDNNSDRLNDARPIKLIVTN